MQHYEEIIETYNIAIDAIMNLKADGLISQNSATQLLEELNLKRSETQTILDTLTAEYADAHSCTANAEGGFCAVCGKDVRTAEDFFGPCELGTCTCCR